MPHPVTLNYLRTDCTQRSRMVPQSVNSAPFKGTKSSLLFAQDVKNCTCLPNLINSPKSLRDSTTHKFVTLMPMWKSKISKLIQTTPPPPFFFLCRCGPTRAMASSFLRFLDHTQWCIAVGRTPLDEWSARRRDLYLTTHKRFEHTISAGERPQTHALDGTATGTGRHPVY